MIKFNYTNNDKCAYTPKYLNNEQSFMMVPESNAGYSVQIGEYVSLEISSSGVVYGINGYAPRKKWVKSDLIMPNYIDGQLIVSGFDEYDKGIALNYNRTWKIFFDKKKNTLCFSDICGSYFDCVTIRFANNLFAVLRGDVLVAVYVILN